jgi:SAM-dependent methyltransferase
MGHSYRAAAGWTVGDDEAVTSDREVLRITFDASAGFYQEARPEYPAELFGELVRLAGLHPGDQVLEIGCATGKATVPLAARGFRLTCVEMGARLAGQARRNLAGFAGVDVVTADFERWWPAPPRDFSLVFAATAWHWLNPVLRYRKSWQLLRPGGHLAFWEAAHVFPAGGDPFFAEIQNVYDEIGEGLPDAADRPAPGALPDKRAEIEASGYFTGVTTRQFDWEVRYRAAEYIRLLQTFSGHIAMPQWKRDRLFGEIRRRLAERPDGLLRRHWGAVLHVARRVARPDLA